MALKLATYGHPVGVQGRITARVTLELLPEEAQKSDYALVLKDLSPLRKPELVKGYAALIILDSPDSGTLRSIDGPILSVPSVENLKDGYIVNIEPATGYLRVVYRPESPHNTIFTTDRCNSNCLMCSQPPKDIDDSDLIENHLRMISLIQDPPEVLGITGGEPTLLGDDLIRLLTALKAHFPPTHIHMLTNGRRYADPSFTRNLAAVGHPSFVSAIPLYADIAGIHDYIVQAHGAFDETVEGLYNAAEVGLRIEIRIVLHKQSIPRLPQLAEFIYWNFPFAAHVALMGLEPIGYVNPNWDDLWIDPVEYMDQLKKAVRYLHHRRMHVSIYNLQLCLLPRELWAFARKSISDFKNIYLDVCTPCSLKDHCSGLFLSQQKRHSAHIKTL